MSDHQLLVELLAIKLYEHDSDSQRWPQSGGFVAWNFICEEDRDTYRRIINAADWPAKLYDPEGGLAS